MSGARGVFPESFKREAVDRGAGGGLSARKAAAELGRHETAPRRWKMKYATGRQR